MTTDTDAANSRPGVRAGLLMAAAILIGLAIAFALRVSPATSLWPLPDGPASFSFMAAILAGSAAPLVWIAISGEWAALAGYGLAFSVICGGMGLSAIAMSFAGDGPNLVPFGLAFVALAIVCVAIGHWGRRQKLIDRRVTPRAVRLGFAIETVVLAGVGAALIIRFPNTLPWSLEPETSTLYGWVFLGLSLYYAFSLRRRAWHHARGQLLGFLAYDILLIGPLLSRVSGIEPQFVLGLGAAIGIVLVSGALGIWFLVIDPRTRGWQPQPAETGA